MAGDAFIGDAVQAQPLSRPKVTQYTPNSTNVHEDGGNTNSLAFPGPLGHNLSITTVGTLLDIFLWDSKNRLTGAYDGPCNGTDTIVKAVVTVDPQNLTIQESWQPPTANVTLNFGYMEMLTETDEIVFSSQQGQIYVVDRTQQGDKSSLQLSRSIDLTPSGVLHGIPLLNSVYDAAGNIWFSTGGIRGVDGQGAQPLTVVGYITPNGTIHSMSVPNQMVENGISVRNTTIFLITGPTYNGTGANATGFFSALQPGPGTSVSVLWNITYDAGSGPRPGSFARGSGSTPTLLGDDYVAVTDNNNTHNNLLIFRQNATGTQKPLCKVPLFQANRHDPGHYEDSRARRRQWV